MKYLYVPFLFLVAVIYVNHFDGNNPKLMVNLKKNQKVERNIASVNQEDKKSEESWTDKVKNYFK